MVLFSAAGLRPWTSEKYRYPTLACDSLIITGLQPESVYELNLGGLNVSSVTRGSTARGFGGHSAGSIELQGSTAN